MHLPKELRDEHCKYTLKRFETVVDRFRKTATRTAIGTLAFFVIFFIPFIKLADTKTKLHRLERDVQSHLEARKQAFSLEIEKLEAQGQALRTSERMLARVDACQQAEKALEQLRRDVERDFTFPLEVPALNSLPAELTRVVPIVAAPWTVDWGTKRHFDRIAHYRVMLAILTRISIHQVFLENKIFAPVLAEIDGASRIRTRQQAEEIRTALLQLQGRVRGEFEAPLKEPAADDTTAPLTPRNFGLWESYAVDPSDPDRQFTAVLSKSFRESLRTDAANVTAQIEQLVSDAPWQTALDDAWSALGLDEDVLQKIESVDLSDKDLRAVLKQLNLEGSMEVVSEQLNAIESSTQDLQNAVTPTAVDLWKLGSKWYEAIASGGSAEPKPDELMDRSAATNADILKADIVRQKQQTLPIELQKVKADIAAAEREAAKIVQRGGDRLKRERDALQARLGSAGKFFGGLPVSLDDAILLFPILLAGGFLICCAQFREAARLRDTYGKLSEPESTPANDVDLTSVFPFPLADADSRQLRRIAIAVPFIFQIAALVLLLVFNRVDNHDAIVADLLDEIPASPASVASEVLPADAVAANDAAGSVGDSADDRPAAASSVTVEEAAGSRATELDSSDTNWIYLVAFLVSTFGMIWGTAYAAGSFSKQASERRQTTTSKTAADSSN